jgi:acetyl-CoA acetyltransferase family protein
VTDAVIVAAVRSPIGRYGGALARERPDDLLAAVLRALVEQSGVDAGLVGEVYAGCGNQAGEDNRDVARMAALLAGFPVTVPGITVNRNCASALDAVNEAARAVRLGECDIAIGGGVESMSRAPWSVPKPASVPTMSAPRMYDTTVGWRYPNPRLDAMYPIVSLGETAEAIADDLGITREQQDAFALESQTRAVAAINAGRFDDEIVPIDTVDVRGRPVRVACDEHPRARVQGERLVLATDRETLAKLEPSFRDGGTVTPGNSCGINDGAAAVLLMSERKAAELGLEPLARWVGAASAGVDPGVMGYGPVPATEKLLARLGLTIGEIDLVEINEAFAAQTLGCMSKLGLDPACTNVNGGAIALGHPTGCSGARILVTLVHELARRKATSDRPLRGLATLCVGVGMGVSTIVETVQSTTRIDAP